MKIVDSFPYNGESIVKLRLAEVYPHVDEIVITEARETHSGIKKDVLFFDKYKEIFSPYIDKITFICIDTFGDDSPPESWLEKRKDCTWMRDNQLAWWRESRQRDACHRHLLSRAKDEQFLLICSDVDEVPDMSFIAANADPLYGASNRAQQAIYLEMAMFYYSFKWMKPYSWYHAYIVASNVLNSHTLDDMRILMPKTRFLQNGGWHCSYFMTAAELLRKIKSFAHRECDTFDARDMDHLKECIENGKDLFGRGKGEDCIESSSFIKLPSSLGVVGIW